MKLAQPHIDQPLDRLPRMPPWVTTGKAETLEGVAFLSGAALAALHQVIAHEDIPKALLRQRLALGAAEACVALSGRVERAGELRDEVHLLRSGEQPGPAGRVYQKWQGAVARPVSVGALHRALPYVTAEQIAVWLDTGQGSPVDRAALVIEAVLADVPRAEAEALILGDAVLALAFGWGHIVPLLAANLTLRDLRKTGDALRLACHRALVASAKLAVQTGSDLARRVARLEAVTPKLRSKAAAQAVTVFLSSDALSPSVALAGFMSDRSARRLCDRLVTLGAVQELTGRDSFRLYGV